MDWLLILEQYGIPVCVAIAFGFFIWKQNKWIQEDLKKDMEDQASRLENISIGLINAQKKMQTDFGRELARLEGSHRANMTLMQKLSGNGLKNPIF